jgi:tetratricopeptide (TPR) repeat protein
VSRFLCSVGLVFGLVLLSGCGDGAPPAAVDYDGLLTTCSDFGADDATRLAACNTIVQASAAPAVDRERALNDRGVMTMQTGDQDHAIADFDAAIQIDPNYAAAFYNRAKAEQNKGDSAGAAADSAAAVRLDPHLAGH